MAFAVLYKRPNPVGVAAGNAPPEGAFWTAHAGRELPQSRVSCSTDMLCALASTRSVLHVLDFRACSSLILIFTSDLAHGYPEYAHSLRRCALEVLS